MVSFSVEKPAHHASQVWSQWDQGDFYIAFKNGRRKTHKKKYFVLKNMKKKMENLDHRWSSSALSEEKWEPPALWLQRFDFCSFAQYLLVHYCLFDWLKGGTLLAKRSFHFRFHIYLVVKFWLLVLCNVTWSVRTEFYTRDFNWIS